MTKEPKDLLIVLLLCLVCVLTTYLVCTVPESGKCSCDHVRDHVERPHETDRRREGTPVGRPLGNPAM